jgi:hypothetical protein
MSIEDGATRPNAVDPGIRSGEILREIQARERAATGDRDIDKVDRRIFRALHQILSGIAVPGSSVEDPIKDAELLRALEPLEALAAESRFAEAAKEIGLSRSIRQLRFLFGSAAVKHKVARKGAAPRLQMATLNVWIVVETAKRAKNLRTRPACELIGRLGGLSVEKDTIIASSTRKLSSIGSMRRRHSEETKRISGNLYFRMFADLCVSQRLCAWQESGKPYEAWERSRLADMARGAPVVSGNYPIFLPT